MNESAKGHRKKPIRKDEKEPVTRREDGRPSKNHGDALLYGVEKSVNDSNESDDRPISRGQVL